MKIFLVEDSAEIRERLRTMIRNIAKLDVIGETDRQDDALRRIFQLSPDVVILDLQLSEGSGMSTLKLLKQKREDIKVIVLTNHAYPQYRKKCMELGADYFLDKSADIKSLTRILAALLAGLPPVKNI